MWRKNEKKKLPRDYIAGLTREKKKLRPQNQKKCTKQHKDAQNRTKLRKNAQETYKPH